jgi:hypothetical protein
MWPFRWSTAGGQVRVEQLAAELGWSRKRLWARFRSQIGLTPKQAAQLVRFDHAADCVAAGVFRPVDPAHAARVLWAASHGAVSLELAGYEGAIDPEACYQDLLAAAAAWFFAPRSPGTRRLDRKERERERT